MQTDFPLEGSLEYSRVISDEALDVYPENEPKARSRESWQPDPVCYTQVNETDKLAFPSGAVNSASIAGLFGEIVLQCGRS
jgi:hypothetical protein